MWILSGLKKNKRNCPHFIARDRGAGASQAIDYVFPRNDMSLFSRESNPSSVTPNVRTLNSVT
jgi:hypothetical protein